MPSHEIALGFKWQVAAGALLNFAILENVIDPYNTPDFGIHLELVLRW